MKIFALLLTLLSTCSLHLQGQVQQYPVTATLQVNPPTSTYLFDYSAPGSNRLLLNLFLNDFNEPDYDVRLRLRIEGNGVSLITNPGYLPPPITLFPGANLLTGTDLENYLNPLNMMVNGIDPVELLQNGSGLPEGMYNVCVEVFSYRVPDRALSQENCALPTLLKNNPPLHIFPLCGNTVPVNTGAQNILFQWQSQADANIAAQYELTLVEVPPGINPNDALNGSQTPLLDAELVTGLSFNYGPQFGDLELGHTYAYRLRVIDMMGLTTFENDGFSEACFFDYGYSANGPVPIIAPADQLLTIPDDQISFQWSRPVEVPAQQEVFYRLKVVELNAGQEPATAVTYNPALHEEVTPVLPFGTNGNLVLPSTIELPGEKAFAWRITALSDATGTEVQVGQSEARVFYSTPAIPQFKVGNPFENLVTVSGLTANVELPDGKRRVSGAGQVLITNNTSGTGRVETIQFTDILLQPYTDFWELAEGEIRVPIENWKIDLDNSGNVSPNNDRDFDGNAEFMVEQLVLGIADTKLKGYVRWEMPHPTSNGGGAIVTTVSKDVLYNDYLLYDENLTVVNQRYDLLDPAGFTLELYGEGNNPAKMSLAGNQKLTLALNGRLETPTTVTDTTGTRIGYNFAAVNNPYYFTGSNTASDNNLRLVTGTTLQLDAQTVTIDLSETESPEKRPDLTWKGLYFDTYNLLFPVDFDKGDQLTLFSALSYPSALTGTDHIAWVDGGGLQFKQERTYPGTSGPRAMFNSFPDNFKNWDLEIVDNAVVTGKIQGFIYIPFLSDTEEFTYTIPFDDNGLQESFLDNSIDGRTVVLNDDKPELRTEITVQQAVFKDNDHLEMTVTIDWPNLNYTATNLTELHLYGDMGIGFGARNEPKLMTNQPEVTYYDKFDITVEQVTVGLVDASYFVALEGTIPLTNDISGEVGAPQAFLVSHDPGIVQAAQSSGNAPANWQAPQTGVKAIDTKVSDFISAISNPTAAKINLQIPFKLNTPVVKLNGMLRVNHNNPDWGTCFAGKVDGKFDMKAASLNVGATIIVGKKDNYKYWLAELRVAVGAKSTSTPTGGSTIAGAGGTTAQATYNAGYGARVDFMTGAPPAIPKLDQPTMSPEQAFADKRVLMVLGQVGITGFKGRVYHHMRSTFDIATTVDTDYTNIPDFSASDLQYLPDNSISYGGLLGVTMIDMYSLGTIAQLEGAMEISFTAAGGLDAIKFELGGKMGNVKPPPINLLKAYGVLHYSETNREFGGSLKAAGDGNYLCGGGSVTMLINDNVTSFNVGSAQFPVYAYPCLAISMGTSGYLDYYSASSGSTLDAGVFFNVNLGIGSGWIGVRNVAAFRPHIMFASRLGGTAALTLKPSFAVNSLGIQMDASLDVGVDYEIALVANGTLDIFHASIHGDLLLRLDPKPTNLSGELSGCVRVLSLGQKCFNVNFSRNL